MPCGTPNCIDCEINALPCPADSVDWPGNNACGMRADTGSCEHTTANKLLVERRRADAGIRTQIRGF